VSVFSPASLGSSCCFFLSSISIYRGASSKDATYHPSTKRPMCPPWKRILNNNFAPRVCFLNSWKNPILTVPVAQPSLKPQVLSVDQRQYRRVDAVVDI
jgi:hypothetical protein